jgi:SpoVK/Ycf46/Vps4 family AAA+-type ATPase
MATARQIVALLTSLNQGDEEQVYAIALQVAAAEAKRGRRSVADELRVLVEQGRNRVPLHRLEHSAPNVVIPITKPRGELQNLLASSFPQTRLSDLILTSQSREHLNGVVEQQRRREQLRHHGLIPTATMLLVGPPGSGKTLTASALAGELHLPLYGVRFDSVITRYMGETASKLRLIFDQIASSRGVYLFDEFDAIGGKRTADNDIGEMRRVLNSFLQFLEEPRSTDSLVLCATNHPELLDRALFRRFGEVLEYQLPDENVARELLQSRLDTFGFKSAWWPFLREAAKGLSHAELMGAAEDTMKQIVMGHEKSADSDVILRNLQRRSAMRESLLKLEE